MWVFVTLILNKQYFKKTSYLDPSYRAITHTFLLAQPIREKHLAVLVVFFIKQTTALTRRHTLVSTQNKTIIADATFHALSSAVRKSGWVLTGLLTSSTAYFVVAIRGTLSIYKQSIFTCTRSERVVFTVLESKLIGEQVFLPQNVADLQGYTVAPLSWQAAV